MLTTWQEELWLKEQSHITELITKAFLASGTFQFPFPLQGSTPKFQSFFPILLPISFNAFTAHNSTKSTSSIREKTNNIQMSLTVPQMHMHRIRSYDEMKQPIHDFLLLSIDPNKRNEWDKTTFDFASLLQLYAPIQNMGK